MALEILRTKNWTLKSFIYTGLCAFPAFLPPIFYLLNFETTNLIKDAGFLDNQFITLNRIIGFFVDLNQGMILTIPLILLLYPFVYYTTTRDIFRSRAPKSFEPLLPFGILIITVIVSASVNWNHGMAVINRYATWLSVVFMIHLFYMLSKSETKWKTIIVHYIFVTQAITTLYHAQFAKFDWSSGKHTPLALYVLQNHPELYNPDPQIFAHRAITSPLMNPESSPFILFKDHKPVKVMVHEQNLGSLEQFGISKENIAKIKDDASFNYGWGYVNMDYFKSAKSEHEIYNIIMERRISAIIAKIRQSPLWLEMVRKKATERNISLEQCLRDDAIYIIYEDDLQKK